MASEIPTPAVLTIGSKGRFHFALPFPAQDIIYTCQALRTINNWIDTDEDPLTIVYLNNQLTAETYQSAKDRNQTIASLQSETGQWFYIPIDYVIGAPSLDGVIYAERMFGINLGYQPLEIDLNALEVNIANIIFDHTGVRPQIDSVIISKKKLLTPDEHSIIDTARRARITEYLSDSVKYQMALTTINNMRAKIIELETYILRNREKLGI